MLCVTCYAQLSPLGPCPRVRHDQSHKAQCWTAAVYSSTAKRCRRAAARSEAAKDAEAEYTAKQLQQQLPVGPQYLSREELIAQVKPTDAELALCSLYSNRSDTLEDVFTGTAISKAPDGDSFSCALCPADLHGEGTLWLHASASIDSSLVGQQPCPVVRLPHYRYCLRHRHPQVLHPEAAGQGREEAGHPGAHCVRPV